MRLLETKRSKGRRGGEETETQTDRLGDTKDREWHIAFWRMGSRKRNDRAEISE